MANLPTDRFPQKRNLFSLMAFIFATIASTEAARQETMQRYMGTYKPRQRNRFQSFCYRLHLRLERACSSIRQEIEKTKGMSDDFSNR